MYFQSGLHKARACQPPHNYTGWAIQRQGNDPPTKMIIKNQTKPILCAEMQIINWEPRKGSRYHIKPLHTPKQVLQNGQVKPTYALRLSLADTSAGFIYFVTVLRQL